VSRPHWITPPIEESMPLFSAFRREFQEPKVLARSSDPEKVRRLHAQGVSINGIAERTGCSKGAVYGVLKLKKKEGAK